MTLRHIQLELAARYTRAFSREAERLNRLVDTERAQHERRSSALRRTPLLFAVAALAALGVCVGPAASVSTQLQPDALQPGDILVIDPEVPLTAVLFRVDPQTGARTIVSDFGGSSSPSAVAVEADGGILVTDTNAGTDPSGGTSEWGVLYRLTPDPVTGDLVRTVLTDFGVGADTGRNPRAVTVEADGQILVTTGLPGTLNDKPLLVRVDPATGARAILSDFRDSSQGVLGIEPRGIAIEAGGAILVIDAQGGPNALGELFRINPQTGFRTSVSRFNTPILGLTPTSVAVEATGQILVTDEGHQTTPLGLLFRIDPQSGLRTVLSDFNTGANTGREPEGVALEADGQILVVDKHAGPLTRGMLFRVDPQTGAREIVTDFGTGANQGSDPLALAVVPPTQGTLTVVTEVVNDNGGTLGPSDFTMSVTGGNASPASFPGQGPPGREVTLDPGSYDAGIVPRAGYTITSFSPDCSSTIAAGETKTCTITADDQPAKLVVVTEVVNDNGGTLGPSDFTMSVTGGNASPASFPGQGPPGREVTLDPGSYDAGIVPRAGYTITSFSPDCSSTIAAGETKTCTITADDQPAKLVVVTEVVNDNGGTLGPSDFTMSVTGGNASPASFPGQGPPGREVTLDPGSYDAGIVPRAGYTITSFSPDCSSTIAAGETKTCTITADDQPPAVPTCDGKVATTVGTAGPTEIRGTSGNDVIVDLDGDNVVRGRGGSDTICTGAGNDQIIAGDGADLIIDSGGQNIVQAGAGDDSIRTGGGADTINAGAGADTIVDTGGNNSVEGGTGNDSVTTGGGADTVNAGAGNDIVTAGDGNNTVNGQGGDDTITTGAGDDRIDGGVGFDTCSPGSGVNQIRRCEA